MSCPAIESGARLNTVKLSVFNETITLGGGHRVEAKVRKNRASVAFTFGNVLSLFVTSPLLLAFSQVNGNFKTTPISLNGTVQVYRSGFSVFV